MPNTTRQLKILASSASFDSAKKIRDALVSMLKEKGHDVTILVTSNSQACKGHTVLMRYGASYGTLDREPVWGNKEFSAMCINKETTCGFLRGLVEVPSFIRDRLPVEFPVLIRQTLTGNQSKGVVVVHNQEEFLREWKDGFVWTPYIQHDAEIRVNAIFLPGKEPSYRIYKKVPRDGVGASTDFIVGGNGQDNVAWILKQNKDYPKVKSILTALSPKMVEAGARFVGMDLIYNPLIHNYVVLELNSGPWLTAKAARWFAEEFFTNTMKEGSW